jgi:hypothetical protein
VRQGRHQGASKSTRVTPSDTDRLKSCADLIFTAMTILRWMADPARVNEAFTLTGRFRVAPEFRAA